jgi:hypothetical protein
LADLACMLLANLTRVTAASRILLQLSCPQITGLYVLQLIEVFCRGKAHNEIAEFDFLASVFANVTLV